MKKISAGALLVLGAFLVASKISLGQPITDRSGIAYQEYQVSISDYRDSYDEYVLARSQYIKFGTLQAEQEARKKTADFLSYRDQVVISYLSIIKIKIEEAGGISQEKQNELIGKIDDEIAWHNQHKNSLPKKQTLQELVDSSNEAKGRYDAVGEVSYQSLTELSYGQVEVYKERFDDIFNGTKDKLELIKGDERDEYKLSDRQLELVDRWVSETELRRNRADELSLNAKETAEKKGYKRTFQGSSSVYNEFIGNLSGSVSSLDEGGRFIQEIIRIVKTKD